MSQVEFPAFQEALVAYYGHLMSQVQQNLIQLEFLRVLQTPSQQQQQISKLYPLSADNGSVFRKSNLM